MTTQEKIGFVIKALRTRRGLSQEQFCAQCGIDQHYVSNIENGQRNISIEVVERIAKFFNLSLSQFFAGVETVEEIKPTVVLSMMIGPDEFAIYMHGEGLSDRTVDKYSKGTPNCEGVQRIIKDVTGVTDNMYHVSDIDQLDEIIDMVKDSEFDKVGHSMYSAGLKKYKVFLESL